MNHLEKTFDSFFSGEAKVAVIKGEWGVGKTYFWENYISNRIKSGNLSQVAYSYISLFGCSSLDDVRKNIFHKAKEIHNDDSLDKSFAQEFTESTSLFSKAPWIKHGLEKAHKKAPLLGWLSKNAQNIPVVGKFSSIISSLEYSLVKNYVVCIDDMERKGSGLSVKEVMGLTDELAQRKSCKVILIFNESTLDDETDKSQFESYREKVVDIEIHHNPTSKENLSCIFPTTFPRLHVLESVVSNLDIKNIRVLRKLKWAYESFSPFLGSDERIVDEFIVHSTLLFWSYYIRDEVLTYDILKEQLSNCSWVSYLLDKDRDIPEGEKKYRSLASSMLLSSSVLDVHISFFLENGYVDEGSLKETIHEFEERLKVDSVSARLSKAWSIYSGSFQNNLDELKAAFKEILDHEIPRLGLAQFSAVIDILEEFKEDISPYIEDYLKEHSEQLKAIDAGHHWGMGQVKSVALNEKIKELQKESKDYSLDDVSTKIATNTSWGAEETNFLYSLTKQDYIDWIKSNPEDITTKIKSGLLLFRNLRSSGSEGEKYKVIAENIVNALKEIAEESELNKMRVKIIYEVE